MIEIKTTIHDKYSIEFKIGYSNDNKSKENNFIVNAWIFIPNSLDINTSTYSKEQFYRDMKSNIRLITPEFQLDDIVNGNSIPFNKLKKSCKDMISSPTQININEYEYQIKMFAAITKSSLRNTSDYIIKSDNISIKIDLCDKYSSSLLNILDKFHSLKKFIDIPIYSNEIKDIYTFGDEYICNLCKIYTLKIIKQIESLTDVSYENSLAKLINVIKQNDYYTNITAYQHIEIGNDKSNRELIHHYGLLKKYIESILYLTVNKTNDGQTAEQLMYGITAGIAMIIATVIALPFQKTLGNYPILLFIVLVISYMLKDRIKDLMRFYFAHKLKNKYYDNKTLLHIKNIEIGWIKEGMDFISNDKTPDSVLSIRNRSRILKADNKIFDEKIILYRKKVFINNIRLSNNYDYLITGINDIIRLHINSFILNMDNPEIPIFIINNNNNVSTIYSKKIYYLNIILQFQYDNRKEYKGFRISATRDGILEIKELT